LPAQKLGEKRTVVAHRMEVKIITAVEPPALGRQKEAIKIIKEAGICRSVVLNPFLRLQPRQQGGIKLQSFTKTMDLFDVAAGEW